MSYLLETPVLLYAAAFLFGLLIGSFLNVCIYRIPRDVSVIAPRSFCPECGHQLHSFENIPLVSYVVRRGRCKYCSQPISWRYPLVELTTGALFLLVFVQHGLSLATLKWTIFVSLTIVLFWTDLEERILPDEITIGGSVAGLILALWVTVPGGFGDFIVPGAARIWQSLFNSVIGGALLSLPIWLIGLLWGRLRRREALGFGDVKLLFMLGIFLGPHDGFLAVTTGAVSGALIGIGLLIRRKKEALSYELPFGSFLCLGALLATFLAGPAQGPLAVL